MLHGRVREERAALWGMNGLTRHQVAQVYAHMAGLDTHHAHPVAEDGEPVALLQTYGPGADRVSECYDAEPGDIGVHLLLAPAGPRGPRPGWTAALTGPRSCCPRSACRTCTCRRRRRNSPSSAAR